MIKENWLQILQNNDVRQNLSKIRQEIKNKSILEVFSDEIKGQEEHLIDLLKSDDAKTRKNAALLMGDLGNQIFLTPLWEAYENEPQRFVKSSYLSAMGNFDYRVYLDAMKNNLETLRAAEIGVDSQKHVLEEIRELSALVLRLEGASTHTFNGWDEAYDVVLITNRNFTDKISDQLLELEPQAQTKLVGAGVMAKVTNLNWIKEIRGYQELLFMIPGMFTCPMDAPEQIAEVIVKSQLLKVLSKSHDQAAPYYFRIELKSKKDLSQKSIFVKKLSAQIETQSNGKLINTTDHYEFEIRVIENRAGNCNILVKFFTIKDNRFTYRKEFMPTSIKPVNAALAVTLAKPYMKEDAQVLDPFCGVGTMLIERHKAVQANTTYGIDLQEEAILKARQNTEIAGQTIHYINRDFFQFEHNYLFDEVISNMPFRIGRMTEDEIQGIYRQFFKKIPMLLKDQAKLILYSHNGEEVKRIIKASEFRLLEEFEVSEREGINLLILQYK